jgi:hypothetical protein
MKRLCAAWLAFILPVLTWGQGAGGIGGSGAGAVPGGSGGSAVITTNEFDASAIVSGTLDPDRIASSTNQYLQTPTLNNAAFTGTTTVNTLVATNVIGNGIGWTNVNADVARIATNAPSGIALASLADVRTNPVAYFGDTNPTATNRIPYWQGNMINNSQAIWYDPWGNPIMKLSPKLPNGGGYIIYLGGVTNLAWAFELSDRNKNGNEPRFVVNFLYDDLEDPLSGEVRWQWSFHTNDLSFKSDTSGELLRAIVVGPTNEAFTFGPATRSTTIQGTNVAVSAGTNSFNITSNGPSLHGSLPYGQWLTWTNIMIMTPAQTPSVVTAVSTFNGSQFTAGSAGQMTNALAGSYRTRFRSDITSDDAATTTYFFAAFTNNVIVTNSIYAHFTVTPGERFTVDKELELWVTANALLDWRVWTFDEVTEGTSFRNTQISFEQ